MSEAQTDVRVHPDFLRELDPRKSYDRGPMALPADGPPQTAPPATARLGDASEVLHSGASRLGEHLSTVTHGTSRDMSDDARDLASMSIADLRRELQRRETAVARLQERRAQVAAELAAVDAEIRRCGGEAALDSLSGSFSGSSAGDEEPAPRRTRVATPRPKNTLNLADALTSAIDAGAVVSPTEAADLVRKSGYLTNSKTFVQTVTVALSKHDGFERIERGRYRCIR